MCEVKDERADLLVFTRDKSSGSFSPTTRYLDYAISPKLIHRESQSAAITWELATPPPGYLYQSFAAAVAPDRAPKSLAHRAETSRHLRTENPAKTGGSPTTDLAEHQPQAQVS